MFPALRRGSRGDLVKVLQYILGIEVDGSFGPVTEKAVKEYQKFIGIKSDGIVGDTTWNRIL